ncbi:MAG: winged helix-turn-helix domain-containing protein [Kofleriaceae bacterium]|nr:winged helix-turn-helix domain-containing protein [Kofleriaceae bacterium]
MARRPARPSDAPPAGEQVASTGDQAAPDRADAAPAGRPLPVGLGRYRLPRLGRARELELLRADLAVAPMVSLFGPAGIGKTTLTLMLGATLRGRCDRVPCRAGDSAAVVRARAERVLGCAPGALVRTLERQARLLVLDDLDQLDEDEAARLLPSLVPGPTALGRVLVVGREPLGYGRGVAPIEHELTGLAPDDAAALWAQLEGVWGATAPAVRDQALAAGRGHPLALRRRFVEAHQPSAWQLDRLPASTRQALVGLAVLSWPAASAALAVLVPGLDPSATASQLLAHQLVDLDDEGRLIVTDEVAAAALVGVPADDLAALAGRAGALVAGSGAGRGPRLAGAAGDDGALAAMDAVERIVLGARLAMRGGDPARVAAVLAELRQLVLARGASAELEAVLIHVGVADATVPALRVELAMRAGRFADAARLAARAPLAPLTAGEVALATGELERAERALAEAIADGAAPPAVRVRALGAQVELALVRGRVAVAERALAGLASQVAADGDDAAVLEHALAEARVAEFTGQIAVARGRLQRVAGGAAADVVVRAEAARARCLTLEGRLSEAEATLTSASAAAAQLDLPAVHGELTAAHAALAARRGDTDGAVTLLRDVVIDRRGAGDELGALRAELELAEVLVLRGEVAAAAELAAVAHASLVRRRADHLAARAEVITASIDVVEVRLDSAREVLERVLASGALDARATARAEVLRAEVLAGLGQRGGAVERARSAGAAEVRDEIDRDLDGAWLAVGVGDVAVGLDLARAVAIRAERLGRRGDLASALVLVARLELARGDHAGARAAATRAVREAAAAGLVRVRALALLALAALGRDAGELPAALAYARDATELATRAGLPVERLAAYAALDGLAIGAIAADPSSPSAATMTSAAIEAAARLLADLGLTAQRPYRVIDADGTSSDIADADPEILRLPARALAVDGVRETIWRQGQELADLRRRSLLKRLLFLFASQPGKVLSKEDIVQSVWSVEYHPLRHDAALFTNIMRIRRLLGEDGADLIRVTEEGYRFVPPRDFVFVQPRT